MAKRINATGSAKILEHDQARVRGLRARAAARASGHKLPTPGGDSGNVPATNQVVDYVVDVNIGTPPTTYSLLVDTGSSNTWVGAGQPYEQTESTRETHNSVEVIYGSGGFIGTEFNDLVSLDSGLTIFGQSIGGATDSFGFDGVDGILGIGPVGLTQGTLSPDASDTIPTITDNLFSQGGINQNLVAISFEPTQTDGNPNGELTFGATDHSKFVGAINFAPITSTFPSAAFFGIDQSLRYGPSTFLLSNSAGIVDTGTTLLLIASDAVQKYTAANGAVFDDDVGLYRLTPAQFANLKSLFFTIHGVVFEFTANAQIWPRALNGVIGGTADFVYLIVGDIGSPSGSGLDVINGMAFIERFYTVFDTDNSRVGIANTPFTRATTN
ncbi:aspartic proteinase from Irpex Lacteus [Trametes versicolor FP-101664 SS1]|uniref:aspartic proteinase from Irpex Lacteus n=1 Tax=Trametes versicolor (strain FP-101664) TaxID=717944 RepID=UPI00046214D1|nr:aspartic proteinase from Irpex Lacteus [Trametes versicolor FP-101664 SS1]EIW58439.1 aspartic proteinase from Irpex Lacteus [Trametes versicolor FP-101664 SS1]